MKYKKKMEGGVEETHRHITDWSEAMLIGHIAHAALRDSSSQLKLGIPVKRLPETIKLNPNGVILKKTSRSLDEGCSCS